MPKVISIPSASNARRCNPAASPGRAPSASGCRDGTPRVEPFEEVRVTAHICPRASLPSTSSAARQWGRHARSLKSQGPFGRPPRPFLHRAHTYADAPRHGSPPARRPSPAVQSTLAYEASAGHSCGRPTGAPPMRWWSFGDNHLRREAPGRRSLETSQLDRQRSGARGWGYELTVHVTHSFGRVSPRKAGRLFKALALQGLAIDLVSR
jgi:hypothetical protein